MSAFAAAVGALFADPNIGRDAVYIADGGAPVLVRVVARRADAVNDFGDARLGKRPADGPIGRTKSRWLIMMPSFDSAVEVLTSKAFARCCGIDGHTAASEVSHRSDELLSRRQ